MISSRWLALGIFCLLLVGITFFDKGNKKFKRFGMMFLEGMVGGFIIDSIGINAGYYYFPRQPFLSVEYFAIVIPCWGVFGLLINCLWNWLGKEKFMRGMVMTLIPLFAFYEGTNILTNSWVYHTPFWAVGLGWMPLVLVFAGCNRRRKVVFKIERLRLLYQGNNLVRGALTIARVALIVVMFPLLISVIVRLCIELPMLIKRDVPIWAYTKYLLVME